MITRTILFALLLACAYMLTACGGGDEETDALCPRMIEVLDANDKPILVCDNFISGGQSGSN